MTTPNESSQAPLRVSDEEMREMLRRIYGRNAEESVLGEFARNLLDPAKPHEISAEGQKRRPRPHPLLIGLGAVAFFLLSVFLYFSFTR